MGKPFYSSCVGWRDDLLDVLLHLQDEADDITLDEFRTRIDGEDWELILSGLGYAEDGAAGLHIEDDYHVSYHLHRDSGIPFLKHSAIEYVFAGEAEIEALHDRLLEAECEEDADISP